MGVFSHKNKIDDWDNNLSHEFLNVFNIDECQYTMDSSLHHVWKEWIYGKQMSVANARHIIQSCVKIVEIVNIIIFSILSLLSVISLIARQMFY
jgi:hypothetical protein